jgi:hypothetical protein
VASPDRGRRPQGRRPYDRGHNRSVPYREDKSLSDLDARKEWREHLYSERKLYHTKASMYFAFAGAVAAVVLGLISMLWWIALVFYFVKDQVLS